MTDYNDILTSLREDPATVLSDDRMRATSMVPDEIYGMKAFMPGRGETYYVVKFIGSGYVDSAGEKKLNNENLKLNKMDSSDRYFVEIWNPETEVFVPYSAYYENKFLNIDLPEIGVKFVTFRRIKDNFYVTETKEYNNTATAKKSADDIFWEKHRQDFINSGRIQKRERIVFSIRAGNKERLDSLLNWRNDDILDIDEENFVVIYPFRIKDNNYREADMIKKLSSLNFSWEEISEFLHLEGDKSVWQKHL